MEEQSDKQPKGSLPSSGLSFAQISVYFFVGFITLMFLVQSNKTLIVKQDIVSPSANYIYDPDYNLDMSHVCLLAKNAHQTKYKDSPCVNKTFIDWYNPWARHLSWKKFWKEKEEKRQEMEKKKAMEEELKRKETEMEMEMEMEMETEGEEPTKIGEGVIDPRPSSEDKDTDDKKMKKKEKQLQLLYAILIALVLMSAMAACWEVVKIRFRRIQAAEVQAQEARQCTLADFTINRHMRRESQQQNSSSLPRQSSLERSKVTQSFIHQSTLDRATPMTSSEVLNLRTERRYSGPAALLDDGNTASKATVVPPPLFRVQRLSSIDVTPEDSSLDARKKPRHFIRRH